MASAVEHYARQARLTALGLIAARRAREASPERLLAVLIGLQIAAATEAATAVPLMLEEQGIDPSPIARPAPVALAGVASDGRSLAGLLALADTAAQFDMIVETQLQDVARAGSLIAAAARPQVTGYVRMVNPGACARCVIQAGKWFEWNEGFLRHPRCACVHVPARENTAGDLRTDPGEYFDTLTRAEQDSTFTKAGAEAIRSGTDMGRVVNGRAGMGTAQGGVVSTGRGAVSVAAGVTRMMPETIARRASSRLDFVKKLAAYGYLAA